MYGYSMQIPHQYLNLSFIRELNSPTLKIYTVENIWSHHYFFYQDLFQEIYVLQHQNSSYYALLIFI